MPHLLLHLLPREGDKKKELCIDGEEAAWFYYREQRGGVCGKGGFHIPDTVFCDCCEGSPMSVMEGFPWNHELLCNGTQWCTY